MRLVWATDIHLNFLSDAEVLAFCQLLERQRPDAIALTGDLAEAPSLSRYLLAIAAEVHAPIYFVLGNHDFYRGELHGVRAQMAELTRTDSRLSWMPARGAVPFGGSLLIGQDGWGDGRLGDPEGSRVELNDWRLIRDLAGLERAVRLAKLRALGDEEAARLRPRLWDALAHHRDVIVLTHVPPFREACWHEGQVSNEQWLPWFTCAAIGQVLAEAADAHPACRLTVLCGHTHGAGTVQIRENLVVHTGAAEYGTPVVAGVLER